ncbi:MAG: heat-inducible transcriptional repressor HrcA [bacterium]
MATSKTSGLLVDERKSTVLKCVVDDFVSTNQPVPSAKISKKLSISPASVRNEMLSLSRMGYLQQPHTSAGRVPTDSGYRFFVDHLMEEIAENEVRRELTRRFLRIIHFRLEQLLRKAGETLAELTDCLCFISIPHAQDSEISKIDITPVSSRRILLILVLSNGMVENKLVDLPMNVDRIPVGSIARALNEQLNGKPISDISPPLLEKAFSSIRLHESFIRNALQRFFSETLASIGSTYLLEGLRQALRQPEFKDSSALEPIISMFENEERKLQVFSSTIFPADVKITIGAESGIGALADCSVVHCGFDFGGRAYGTLGVIGPKRMHYPRVSALVRVLSSLVSKTLREFSLA